MVTELRDSVYYADLVLATEADEVTVSSRPSDAIALAARMGAPLFATLQVLEDAGIEIRDEDEEAEIEKFREFLDDINSRRLRGWRVAKLMKGITRIRVATAILGSVRPRRDRRVHDHREGIRCWIPSS